MNGEKNLWGGTSSKITSLVVADYYSLTSHHVLDLSGLCVLTSHSYYWLTILNYIHTTWFQWLRYYTGKAVPQDWVWPYSHYSLGKSFDR